MSTKKQNKYTPEFKQTIVNLYHSGKTYAQIKAEYGVSSNALTNWLRQYSEVKLDDNTVVAAPQATIDRYPCSVSSTFNFYSLPCSEG